MSIFAIADLHLSFSENIEKPMDVFGGEWVGYTEKLRENWESLVSAEDTVIIGGDISWALKFEDAVADLEWIRGLPGKKILLKGNHDLWWNSIKMLNSLYGDEMRFLQNSFFGVEGLAVCGSRGWLCPGDEDFTEHDEKIYKREVLRLRSSLEAAVNAGFRDIIGVMHFPPASVRYGESGFTDLFREFGVLKVFYGHLHGADGFRRGISGNVCGVEYKLVSVDYLRCMPFKVEV